MEFTPVLDPSTGHIRWYLLDALGNFEVSVRECSDSVGAIASVRDDKSGELVKNLYGSSMQIAGNAALQFCNSITATRLIALM